MPNIPFSVKALKQLERQLNALAKDLPVDIKTHVEDTAAEEVAAIVRQNISTIANPDGNYEGYDAPEASVTVGLGFEGAASAVIWRGRQIAYLEFGTGATGAATPYQGSAMGATGYSPDPTKSVWVYKDAKSGEPEVSVGIPPYAPMYNAAVQMRIVGKYQNARKTWKRAVKDALTV